MSEIKEIPLADVKVGMRVRVTVRDDGAALTITYEGPVRSLDEAILYIGTELAWERVIREEITGIELLEPTPHVWKTGDRFRDRFGDCYTVGDPATHAVQYTGSEWASLGEIATLAEEFGPLTPIPEPAQHGDGCSPWLWDPITKTVWVEVSVGDSGITHQQIAGDGRVFGGNLVTGVSRDMAIAARLVPWSERDHG